MLRNIRHAGHRGRWTFACLLGFIAASPILPARAEPAPENSRTALIHYLDGEAARQLEARSRVVTAIATPVQAQARQAAVRAKLLTLIGTPVHGVPLAAKVTGHSQGDGYRVENVLFDAQPGRHVTANLFLPASGTGPEFGPFPALILSPGHVPNGKLSDYSFAANFARNGFVVLSYDIVGEGERLEYFDAHTGKSLGERPTGDHSLAAYPAILNGEDVARYFIEDAMQGVDYLASRPEVDAKRIGAFGCSGGGTVTAYLAALDERIQAAAVACYTNDFSHLLASAGPQDAEQSIPDFIASGFDIPDWMELAAPKPYAIVSTTEDMFPFAGAQAAVDEIRHFWGAYGAADRVTWLVGPGPHGAIAPMGDRIVDFFRQALKPNAPARPFQTLKPEREDDIRVTPSGQLLTSVGSVTLADLARERTQAIAPRISPDAAALRTAIRRLARVETQADDKPAMRLLSETVRDGLTMRSFELPSDMGPLELRQFTASDKKAQRALLLLDPAPLDELAKPGGRLEQLAQAGWSAFALQTRGADGKGGAKSAIVGDQDLLALRAMLVGHPLPGIRIADTLHAIDAINALLLDVPLRLDGVGTMGPIALQAALLDASVSAVRTKGAPVSWRAGAQSPTARDLPANAIPGVLAVYDLPDVVAALAPRQVEMAAPVDSMGAPLSESQFREWVPAQTHVRYMASSAWLQEK